MPCTGPGRNLLLQALVLTMPSIVPLAILCQCTLWNRAWISILSLNTLIAFGPDCFIPRQLFIIKVFDVVSLSAFLGHCHGILDVLFSRFLTSMSLFAGSSFGFYSLPHPLTMLMDSLVNVVASGYEREDRTGLVGQGLFSYWRVS